MFKIENNMLEIHGPPDSGKTKMVLDYICYMQQQYNALTLYVDANNKLYKYSSRLDKTKTWFCFDLTMETQRIIIDSIKMLDIIIIDDLTLIKANLWDFLAKLRSAAKKYNTIIILINQQRFLFNSRTNDYENMPYMFNAVQRYCDFSYDLEKNKWIDLRCADNIQYDDITNMLINFSREEVKYANKS